MDVKDLLAEAVSAGASDLHLTVGEAPTFRLHGRLYRVEGYKELEFQDTLNATSVLIG